MMRGAQATEACLREEFAADVRAGLLARPKRLPPRWLYDAMGSTLFEAITLLPEYYLTRTEQSILDAHAEDVLDHLGGEVALVELGAGSGRKTRTLLRALLRRQGTLTYRPIDISASALEAAGATLGLEFPGLAYKPIVDRYRPGLARIRDDPRPKLVLFLGSSIGNFDPPEAAALLRDVAGAMGPRDRLLLGLDLDKDPAIVGPAYDDAQGVTRAFSLNVLARINRELGGAFDLRAFRAVSRFERARHRVETHLVSVQDQRVEVRDLGLAVDFEAGEAMHTESSYKFTDAMVERMVRDGGMRGVASRTDSRRWFALHLLAPAR